MKNGDTLDKFLLSFILMVLFGMAIYEANTTIKLPLDLQSLVTLFVGAFLMEVRNQMKNGK